ncbi:MAG: hypothetical protein ACOZNI_10240 [Myxococcota bacterium]
MPLLLLLACETEQLSQSWQIDRLRVLAVAAEPAEPLPGDVVTFSALVVSPVDPWAGTAWMVCLDPTDTSYGCQIDASALDEDADLEDLIAAGFVGFDPYWPPVWEVPSDALDDLAEEDQREGKSAFVNLAAFHEDPDGEPDPETGFPAIDAEDVEAAFKRVPVSRAPTPNHNPAIATLRVDGVDVAPGTLLVVDAGQPYTIEVVLADDAVETYSFVNRDGAEEERTEEPYFTFYAQEGSFDFGQTYAVWPDTEVDWVAPSSPEIEEQSLWAVVRDRRGGMGWTELRLRVR